MRVELRHMTVVEPDCECGGKHPDQKQCRAAQRIEPVIHHMFQNVNQTLCVSTLSAVAGVSTSHFHSVFKSVTGCAPIDFFIRLRMRRACELLRDRKLKIKEIAALLGYDDPFYFSRIFRSVMGIPARDYRNMILGAQEKTD